MSEFVARSWNVNTRPLTGISYLLSSAVEQGKRVNTFTAMFVRAIGALGGLLMASACLSAEFCVICLEPAATYRCIPDHKSTLKRFGLDTETVGHLCAKVLKKLEKHGGCQWHLSTTAPCDGPAKTIGLTELEQAFAGDGPSTRVPSLAEKISTGIEMVGRNLKEQASHAGAAVENSWHCIASLFIHCEDEPKQ